MKLKMPGGEREPITQRLGLKGAAKEKKRQKEKKYFFHCLCRFIQQSLQRMGNRFYLWNRRLFQRLSQPNSRNVGSPQKDRFDLQRIKTIFHNAPQNVLSKVGH